MLVAAPTSLDQHCVNVLRGLAIDAVQRANSGHPGLPLGAAPMAFQLWRHHLRHNPSNPQWMDRDRFILSAGHGSMLLYGLLHVFGYDMQMDDLKAFRQWGSITPGHPENTHTAGVEMATGPLGQGCATSVGMAIAEAHLAAKFEGIFDHYTYVLCGDGDLMEGVAQEAASLAGHLRLGKLIWLYDDNKITIDGSTDLAFTEDTERKFAALGWHTQRIDGMDMVAVGQAILAAQGVSNQPSIILARTTIGFGSPAKAGTASAHGSPLGVDEVAKTKEALGLPAEEFYCPDDVTIYCQDGAGARVEAEWTAKVEAFCAAHPELGAELRRFLSGDLEIDWTNLPTFDKAIATRNASSAVLNAIADQIPVLLGGSADLTENVFTNQKAATGFQHDNPTGRNIYYGVREHAMAAAANGITLHGAKAIAGTFLIFSDYCRPSIRLAALMHQPTIFNFSHDSIGLGEDGPTHQPVEQIMSLRLIPNLNVFRPADAHEVAVAWNLALASKATPTAIITSRQALGIVTPAFSSDHPAHRGGYVLKPETGPLQCVLVATGSEVELALKAATELGTGCRVVSLPSWFLFDSQSVEYKESVLPNAAITVSVEAGVTIGWAKYAKHQIGIDTFGASAPGATLFEKFGFTVERVVETVRQVIA